MTKIHGLNVAILLIWVAMTCGGLGNAAYKYDCIYWVPFIVNALIALILGYKEIKGVNGQVGLKMRQPQASKETRRPGVMSNQTGERPND